MAHLEATIRSKAGPILPGATVTVYEAGTQTPASLFSDDALTVPIENPTLADSEGVVNFYVAADEYDMLIQRFDIKDRLLKNVSIVEAATSGSPVGPAGGDLGGAYPNPGVTGIQNLPVTSNAPFDGEVLTWDAATQQVEWDPPALVSDPAEVVLHATEFGNLEGFTNNFGATNSGTFILLESFSDRNFVCTTKLPDSYYGKALVLDILANAEASSGTARMVWDLANSTAANAPAHASSVVIPATGSPAFVVLGADTIVQPPLLGGMVQVIVGRDVSHVDDTVGRFRAFAVRIRPA